MLTLLVIAALYALLRPAPYDEALDLMHQELEA